MRTRAFIRRDARGFMRCGSASERFTMPYERQIPSQAASAVERKRGARKTRREVVIARRGLEQASDETAMPVSPFTSSEERHEDSEMKSPRKSVVFR